MAARSTSLRRLDPRGRKICGYSVGASTAVMAVFVVMFVMCFFFLDMEMVYQKAGMTRLDVEPPSVLLQRDFALAASATHEFPGDNFTTPLVHVTMEATDEPAADEDGNENVVAKAEGSDETTKDVEPATEATEDVEPATEATEDVEPATGATEDVEPATGATEDVEPATGATEDVEPATGATEDVEPATEATEDIGPTTETPTADETIAAVDVPTGTTTTVELTENVEAATETPTRVQLTVTDKVATESLKIVEAAEESEAATESSKIDERKLDDVELSEIETDDAAASATLIEMPREARSLVGCDITQGSWVFDNITYPLYRTKNCPFADPGFRCEDNGRPDKEFMSYHWQPHDCDLPRFNASDVLERLRGQRMVFVGDSLGRNNWESMLCMLAEGVPDKSRIYEVNGEPITKHSGKLVYKFMDYDCTVEYYRDPFLVPQTRPPRGSPANVSCALRVDHVSWRVDTWSSAEIIIFNAGHWWTENKIFRQGCRFQEGGKLMSYDLQTGLRKALHTWSAWLENNLDTEKTEVFWLSFPTVHFRGGTWNRGGHCHQEKRPLTEEEAQNEWQTPWMNQIVKDEFMANIKKKREVVTYLDITTATNYRPDGHGALYTWDTKKFGLKPRNRQDCSHFCLPGVPDAWNELILASMFAKGKKTWAQPVRL